MIIFEEIKPFKLSKKLPMNFIIVYENINIYPVLGAILLKTLLLIFSLNK